MGFTRSRYRCPADSHTSIGDHDAVGGSELKNRRIHIETRRANEKGVAEVTEELLDRARDGRSAVDDCDPPFVTPEAVAEHNSVDKGIFLEISPAKTPGDVGYCTSHRQDVAGPS
ncbi:hypothetical protein EHS25_002777 [Saitozyma podzolica]|uniref:Uncharacterized protein n=1 Tax=Saitozyma podzolica TaxID=1890683 RepID=A0A427YD75_9TREE|nr:hypothetical protein EHS25_002777 [Saitozyma podzolica]